MIILPQKVYDRTLEHSQSRSQHYSSQSLATWGAYLKLSVPTPSPCRPAAPPREAAQNWAVCPVGPCCCPTGQPACPLAALPAQSRPAAGTLAAGSFLPAGPPLPPGDARHLQTPGKGLMSMCGPILSTSAGRLHMLTHTLTHTHASLPYGLIHAWK